MLGIYGGKGGSSSSSWSGRNFRTAAARFQSLSPPPRCAPAAHASLPSRPSAFWPLAPDAWRPRGRPREGHSRARSQRLPTHVTGGQEESDGRHITGEILPIGGPKVFDHFKCFVTSAADQISPCRGSNYALADQIIFVEKYRIL